MTRWQRTLISIVALLWASRGLGIDVVSMYRGSCQVDTGVVLRVDSKTVTYLRLDGLVTRIPRFEIVGVASYPLPSLPITNVRVPLGIGADFFEFQTYRDGRLVPLATGWPIEYNAEHIQMLTSDGKDHLVARDDIWSVRRVIPPESFSITSGPNRTAQRYKLRHPLPFEKCADNVTPGEGEVVPVIPQTTHDNPIAIKRNHDHLREGILLVEDYDDRQRFYAVPQYFVNRTLLGTWGLLGSRYANVGSRQVNFLPLVQDELSEGPFGFQRVVRSGVAPLRWGLHEEPTVQVFYGLKADYVHLEVFMDPTAPLIGSQYNYSKGQLNVIDDRLVEKGGMEFGFDFGYASVFVATSGGNIALRVEDFFESASLSATRFGLSGQYNYYRVSFYAGEDIVPFNDHVRARFEFQKLIASGPITPRLSLSAQLIRRSLEETTPSSDKKRQVEYRGVSQTLAAEADYDLSYRWTIYGLFSAEQQRASGRALASGADGKVDKIHPKLFGGVSVMF